MKTFLLLITFVAFPALAQVNFTPTRQILMEGKTCAELNAQAQSIIDWAFIVHNAQNPLPECFCSSKSCQMDVAPISPFFVKQVTNYDSGSYSFASSFAGPNCFNAALVSASTTPHLHFTHPFEMTAVLESSLCTEKKLTDTLLPGDILVVRDQRDKYFNIHAGVYINEHLSFSKYGESNMMPYSYGLDVDKSYGAKDEACRRIEGTPQPGDHCYQKPYVNFFRCTPFYAYISKIVNQPGGLNESVRNVYAQLSGLEKRISDIAFKNAQVDSALLQKYQDDLTALYAQTEVLGKDNPLNQDNKELAWLLRNRIFSLHEQNRRIAKGLGDKAIMAVELPAP